MPQAGLYFLLCWRLPEEGNWPSSVPSIISRQLPPGQYSLHRAYPHSKDQRCLLPSPVWGEAIWSPGSLHFSSCSHPHPHPHTRCPFPRGSPPLSSSHSFPNSHLLLFIFPPALILHQDCRTDAGGTRSPTKEGRVELGASLPMLGACPAGGLTSEGPCEHADLSGGLTIPLLLSPPLFPS